MRNRFVHIVILILMYFNIAACASSVTEQTVLNSTDEHQFRQHAGILLQPVTDHSQRVIGKIDWQQGRIYSYGHGHMRSRDRDTVVSGRQQALTDAEASMLDVIRQLQVDAYSKASMLFRYAVISRAINERVQQSSIEEIRQYNKDKFHVTTSLSLTGENGLTQIFIPTLRARKVESDRFVHHSDWNQYDQTHIWPDNYSSVIIDARGSNYRPALFASIVDEHGRSLYSLENVDPNAAMFMLCEYTDNMLDAKRSTRAGATPLILEAQPINNYSSANYVLSREDAEKLVAADSRGRFLHQARVIVLIDE